LSGNDTDQALEDQPGNQLGGIDMRWSLPWAPVALYMQAIGEDEADLMPSKYLGIGGAEVWGGWGERSWRAHVEYRTRSALSQEQLEFGCAYTNAIFRTAISTGSRDRPRDRRRQQTDRIGAMLVNGDGSTWGWPHRP
jgi:hypothetical protein